MRKLQLTNARNRFAPFLAAVPGLLVLLIAAPAFSQSAQTQTDWSGGSGRPGPVLEWGKQFDNSSSISWRSIAGQIALSAVAGDPVQHIIAGRAGMPDAVGVGDLNGDGRIDVVSGDAVTKIIQKKGAVYWWENLGSEWSPHLVDGDFWGVYYVDTADVDGDGDVDVIAAAYYGVADPAPPPPSDRNGRFAWFENLNGDGSAWSQHVVGEMFWGASYIDAADFDGDGDLDLLGSAEIADGVYEQDGDVVWFENLDGTGDTWAQHDLVTDFDNALRAIAVDLDGDGDMDVVAAKGGDLSWWDNVNGDASVWTKRPIFVGQDGAGFFDVGDLDNDGDADIIGSSYNAVYLFWWENLDGTATAWQTNIIGGLNHIWDIDVGDIDGDGDLDALISRSESVPLAIAAFWAENPLGQGNIWSFNLFKTDLPGRTWVAAGDANTDGKLDAILAFEDPYREETEQLSWFDLTRFTSSGSLVSSILDGGTSPLWDTLSWDADVRPGSSLAVQVRASNDPLNLGSFATVPFSGYALSDIIDPAARFLQYRLILESTDPGVSPVVREVTVGPATPELALSAPVPGTAGTVNSITAAWSRPGDRIYFGYSLQSGSTTVPGICPYVELGLAEPKLLGSAIVDQTGEATLVAPVPSTAAGKTIYLQAIEPNSCTASNLISHAFE